VFGGVWSIVLLALVVGFGMGGGVCKNRSRHGKGGIIAHYCAIPPYQPPFIAYNIAQYIFPTTPFIAVKYWEYLVRAKVVGTSVLDKSHLMHSRRGPASRFDCGLNRVHC